MPRNQPLLSLLQSYRHEARLSSNVAHNASAREGQVYKLQKKQAWLWAKHDWPHLRARRVIPLQAGQRYYDPRAAYQIGDPTIVGDLSMDRLELVEVRYGDEWCKLTAGIGRRQYSVYDSDLDVRSWPVENWQIFEDDAIEIWPVPADNANLTSLEGMLRLTGIRDLRPLVADDDRADLDDQLIVLFSASDKLAGDGAKDAQLTLDRAKKLENDLTGNLSKRSTFRLFGSEPEPKRAARMPRVHYRTV